MNDYYVYIYYRLDTNEPFYVGKGKYDRWKYIWDRNKHFKNIINKYPVAVEIIKDNLTEEQALGIECWLIHELVFEYGFSIEIQGSNSNDHYCHLVNQTWGGEGVSGHKHTEEAKQKISIAFSGENHPMYGKHHAEETKNKMSQNHADFSGENHPFYGKHHAEETKNKMSQNHWICDGKNHPSSKSVISLTTKRIFFSAREGARYYNIKSYTHITSCCKGDRKSCGKYNGQKLVWKYLNYKHNKTLRPINYRFKEVI